jgi:hypothetical protein
MPAIISTEEARPRNSSGTFECVVSCDEERRPAPGLGLAS